MNSFLLSFCLLSFIIFNLFGIVYSECNDCMNDMPMAGCEFPSFCGYSSYNCSVCSPIKTPDCSARLSKWCANINCNDCMGGMPMDGCPDPSVCGMTPIPCTGCVYGKSRPGCPEPKNCGNFLLGTPPCFNCTDGVITDQCPDPYKCGFKPSCINCMPNMPMNGCPDYDACAAAGLITGCVMQMYFNLDQSACILIQSWNISARGEWTLAIIIIIIAAFAREGVSFYRSYRLFARKRAKNQLKTKYSHIDNPELKNSLLKDNHNAQPTSISSSSSSSSTPWYSFAIDSFCYCLQHTLSYLLMLVIMTYNFYLFIAVILSFSVAHFSINYLWGKIKEKKAQDNANYRINQSINGKNDKNGPSIIVAAGGSKMDDPEQKTGGDHCCEDFDFDE